MSETTKKNDKPFSHPRWHETIGGKAIGHKELTEEEQKKAHEDTVAVLRSMGVELEEEEK
jgi:trimethylamine:corrinoid methyltransferase-like protein